jgi:predicted GNAT family acetyltransferase
VSLFSQKKRAPQLVTSGRFELEQDGHMAALDYTLAGDLLGLLETEVPEALRGTGIASLLAKTALEYAREHHLKVDVTCPFVAGYLKAHPEYEDLLLR